MLAVSLVLCVRNTSSVCFFSWVVTTGTDHCTRPPRISHVCVTVCLCVCMSSPVMRVTHSNDAQHALQGIAPGCGTGKPCACIFFLLSFRMVNWVTCVEGRGIEIVRNITKRPFYPSIALQLKPLLSDTSRGDHEDLHGVTNVNVPLSTLTPHHTTRLFSHTH